MTRDLAVIFLAGGSGQRFGSEIPKQFVALRDKPISSYSYEILATLKCLKELIIVCDPSFRSHFPKDSSFALPGPRRQDSVFSGLQALTSKPDLVLIHDAARPFIPKIPLTSCIEAARLHGAAALGVPIKFTIKESGNNQFVSSTPDRSKLWEIQTPQVIKTELLFEGFKIADKKQLTVTDDVSLVELLGHPVKLVESCYTNIKITTPDDMVLANQLVHG